MSHGEAWEFFQLGKYLERACQTARILDVKYHILLPTADQVGTPIDNAHWVAILMSCSGYEPFHKQRAAVADPGVAVADFLIFDSTLSAVGAVLPGRMPRPPRRDLGPADRRRRATRSSVRCDDLLDWLNLRQVDDFVAAGLHEALTSVIDRIHGIGDGHPPHLFRPARQPDAPRGCRWQHAQTAGPAPA